MGKKVTAGLMVLVMVTAVAVAQINLERSVRSTVKPLPATCTVGQVWITSTPNMWVCITTNTWTRLGTLWIGNESANNYWLTDVDRVYFSNNEGDALNTFRVDAYLNSLDFVVASSPGASVGGSIQLRTIPAGGGDGLVRLQVMPDGGIRLPYLPSTNPGAGSKQLWYDPADGNTVKFAP